jgi:hypothetical protein
MLFVYKAWLLILDIPVLSFFYPSTEWEMAQPFDCWCGAGEDKCFGRVQGAINLDTERLGQYYLNGYIMEMLKEAARRSKREDPHLVT